MSSPVDAAKSLIRTTVRTCFPNPRHTILIDLILAYKVLQVEDFAAFLNNAQPKEIRALLNPLASARLISKATKSEVKIGAGSGRAVQREYYYVNYHEAVDAIKYRLVKLREKVENIYKEQEGKRKDWSCPRLGCQAQYDELEILDHVGDDGFYCQRCGATLEQNIAAVRERGNHEKIRKLNDQMIPFNKLLSVIDAGDVPQNDFNTAWETRRDLPEDMMQQLRKRVGYMGVSQKNEEIRKTQAVVDASALETSIADERTRAAEDAEAKRIKQELAAKQNQLPAWHTASAIGQNVKKEEGGVSPNPLAGFKKEAEEEKKALAESTEEKKMQDDLDAYMAEMERERLEQERKQAEESGEDEDEEDDFEDIPGSSAVGTPVSSQQAGVKQEVTPTSVRMNGLKRGFDLDGESVNGTSSGANTPVDSSITSLPDPKRVKLENGAAVKSEGTTSPANGAAADSDEDEDFEDV